METMITPPRESVVQGFFWILFLTVSLLATYFLITGGPEKKYKKDYMKSNAQQQIERYKAVLVEKPYDLKHLVGIGDLYLDTDNAHEAFKSFSKALEVDPDNVHVLSDLASIYQRIGRYDQALEKYQRAYQLNSSHSSILLNMALIYSRNTGDTAKALELLQQFLESNPEPQLIAAAQKEIELIKRSGNTSPDND